jgi:hypothetical protein
VNRSSSEAGRVTVGSVIFGEYADIAGFHARLDHYYMKVLAI